MSDQEFRLTDESALDIFGMGYLTVFELDARMINLNAAIRVWRTWLAERDARIEAAAEQRGAVKALQDAAKDWRWSAWADTPKNPIAAANYVGDWISDRADQMEGDDGES